MMKSKITYVFLSLMISTQIWASESALNKPFQNALILPGGGFGQAMHIGTYHAMLESGIRPDLIIGTCGGGLAAAIIEKYPNDPQAQIDFLLKPEVHQLMLSIDKTRAGKTFNVIPLLINSKRLAKKTKFLKKYILDVSQDFSVFQDSKMTEASGSKDFSTIIQSVEYAPAQNKERPYTQIYFTDESTAKYLEGHESPLFYVPKSRVSLNTETITDFKLADVSRATIADPYLMKPLYKDNQIFMTGAIDALPIGLASQLAYNTFYYYENDLPGPFDRLFKATFGFRMMDKIDRERVSTSESMISNQHFNEESSVDPKFGLSKGIHSGVPKSYEKYKKIVLAQYQIAKDEVKKIIQQNSQNAENKRLTILK